MEHPLPDAAFDGEPEAVLDLVDVEEDEEEPENAALSEDERLQTADPLKLYVRQIGDGRLLTAVGRARARPAQGPRRRAREAPPDRVQPSPRDVDHAQLHEGRRAASRPDPGRQPRPDPRGREVRLQDGLQALDLRDLVDPPGRHARARRPGPDDPASRPRRRAGAPGAALAPRSSRRSSTATRRSTRSPTDAGFTPERVGELFDLVEDPVSLETPVGDGESMVADLIEDEKAESPDGATADHAAVGRARRGDRPAQPADAPRRAASLRARRPASRRRSKRSATISGSPANACASSSRGR